MRLRSGSVARSSPPRSLRWAAAALVAALLTALGPAGVARAQGAEEEPPVTVSGNVSGALTKGSRVTFRVTARSTGGFRALHLLTVRLLLHGIELERLTVDVDDGRITAGGGRVIVGTANVLIGAFFQVHGFDVETTTAGDRLSTTIRAQMLQTVPPGARFELIAEDDFDQTASVTRVAKLPPPPKEAFPWGALAAAAATALFVGGFAGNLLASRRRPPPRISVYGHIQRRLEEERTGR